MNPQPSSSPGFFLEGLIAPDFSVSALNILKSKKNLRILKWPEMLSSPLSPQSVREIMGGFLVQTRDSSFRPVLVLRNGELRGRAPLRS